ncbi:MAG TPA: hemolysin family protein [Afifellaceae bacterium]|nr:hemolysin family protein [Afifellaceae bacterium]
MTDEDIRSRLPSAEGSDPSASLGIRLRSGVRSLFGLRQNGSARVEIEEALAADEIAGAAFSPEERAMLRAVLKLGDMRVEDVMVPRADIDAVDIQTPIADLLIAFAEAGHSRMPVYRETLDDPIGMAHIKDAMIWITRTAGGKTPKTGNQSEDGDASSLDLTAVDLSQTLHTAGIIRPVLFVPPSMSARMLLGRMQASRTQMALVIDEYGGTDGIVSLEDLVEIIVGEIEDEHDEAEEPTIEKVAEGQYVADARTPIEDVCELIGPTFDVGEHDEDVDTIGGLVFSLIDRVPVRGEIINALEGFEFEVLDADPRRIKRLRIRERRKARHFARAKAKSAAPEPVEPKPAAESTGKGTAKSADSRKQAAAKP